MASPSGGRPPLKVAGCPLVAELIDYAWNRLESEERQRLETHLRNGPCRPCQSWIERARQQAPPAAAAASNALADSQWQKQAFTELSERLRALDENV